MSDPTNTPAPASPVAVTTAPAPEVKAISTVKVYNRGQAVYIYKGVRLEPGKYTEVPRDGAERLIREYPRDLISDAQAAATSAMTAQAMAEKDAIIRDQARQIQALHDENRKLKDTIVNAAVVARTPAPPPAPAPAPEKPASATAPAPSAPVAAPPAAAEAPVTPKPPKAKKHAPARKPPAG
jgi:hypothetical protein